MIGCAQIDYPPHPHAHDTPNPSAVPTRRQLLAAHPRPNTVEDAKHHDSVRAEAATANLGNGDILVADRAYTDFGFMNALALRHVFFVVREKTNLVMEVVETLQDPVEYDGESKSTQILAVELFFKELKQTCQLHDFVGYNENAVKWQIWTGFLHFTMTPVG